MLERRRAPDFLLFIVVLSLVAIGIVMVFSASCYFAQDPEGPFKSPYFFLRRQLFYAALGLGVMIWLMNYDYRYLKRYAHIALLISFFLLAIVLIPGIGASYLGARRWLNLGPASFQPSELAKLGLIIFTAYGLTRDRYRIQRSFTALVPYLVIMAAAAGLILAEPDLGTAVTLAGTIMIMLFVAGARFSHMALLGLAGVAAVGAAIATEPYRLRRFLAFLHPEADPTGAGWHILNSLMSLGSGGLLGTGLGQGRHSKFLFLPERHTDFIFAAIGEELGFIGACTVIVLFILFIWRGLRVAIMSADPFASLVAAGIVAGIALQAIINIGVVTSSLPITGITLPFISFGGSSLVFTLAGVGVLLNISRYIHYR